MPSTPRRFELGEPYRNIDLRAAGTTVVRTAAAWGYHASFRTNSPCCIRGSLIDAAMWAGTGKRVTCAGCGWKWDVYPAAPDGARLPQLPREDATHPGIACDRADWVSTGYGTRPYTSMKRVTQ